MSRIAYEGDSRLYLRYKIQGRFFVKCLQTKTIDNIKHSCTYQNKREDKHKASIKAGHLHECRFEPNIEPTNSILNYYLPNKSQEPHIEFTEQGLKSKLVYLIGKKNISIDTAASDEFYDFITYCIAFGLSIQTSEQSDLLSVAKKAFQQCKNHSLHKTLIQVSKEMKTQMIEEFAKFVYCSVSIDEGSTAGVKNLDFNIEYPLGSLKPFTIYSEIMEGTDADHYAQYLLNGLSYAHRQNIHIACAICDGNTAQKMF